MKMMKNAERSIKNHGNSKKSINLKITSHYHMLTFFCPNPMFTNNHFLLIRVFMY